MKTIIFLRHAKSSWKQEGIDDSLRQLKSIGYEELKEVSSFFKESKLVIDKIISSRAVRAYTTAAIFMKDLNLSPNLLILDNNLYESTPALIIKTIQRTSDSINTLLIVGHNPSLSSTLEHLTSDAFQEIPTGSLFTLQATISSWSQLKRRSCIKLFEIIPSHHSTHHE